MVATTKLIVWNEALREIGDHPLTDTTTPNTAQDALNSAWDHAVEYVLSRRDWNFARRRATLTGISDTSHPPYVYRYARPSDYLRKIWVKNAADDEFQIPHAEIAAVIYGHATSALIEYISDHSDNYDPANWPPQFTRVLALYLAMLVAPKLGRVGMDDAKTWYQKIDIALQEAERSEAVTTISADISTDRDAVMRRAIEILGQRLEGAVPVYSDVDALRWQLNRGWETMVKFVLEQAPWNFALRRATLTSTADATYAPYAYRFARPSGFLKRVWIRETATDAHEADYTEAGTYFYGHAGTKVLEYIAADAAAMTAANWPASFAELVATYMAAQLAPAGGSVTTGEDGKERRTPSIRQALMQQFAQMLEVARTAEASQHQSKQVPAARQPVMRRAMEIMGQQLTGFTITNDMLSRMRWQMNLTWDNALEYVLSQGAWNFATKRAVLEGGDDGDANVPTTSLAGVDEGYSVEPASSSTSTVQISGYDYSFPLPEDFVHKIWLKADVAHDAECQHQFMGGYVFVNNDPAVMEYVANDSYTSDPANWPIGFSEAITAYLTLSVAPEMAIEVAGGRGARAVASQQPHKLEQAFRR